MAGDRYIGMTFVYDTKCISELYKKKAKIVEVIAKKYDGVSGYVIKNLGGIYVNGKYAAGWIYREKPSFNYIPRKLDESRHKIIWIEEIKDGIESLKNIWFGEFGRMVDVVIFRSFPPKKYLDKYMVEYEENFPYPLGQKEGPEVDIVTKYNTCYGGDKDYVALDFGTYENYFYSEDEKLNKAMEEFLVDLMRDIAIETNPEYAYMDLNEYKPLENDPVCENMKELVRYNSKFGKGMYVEAGQIFYVRKDIIEKECGKDLSEVYHPYYEDRYRVFIEELDGHYLMHGEDFVYTKNYPIYKCLNREQEYEILSKIPEEIVIKGVCGDIENGLRLKVSGYRGDEKESDILEKIEKWSKKYGIKIIDIKIQ